MNKFALFIITFRNILFDKKINVDSEIFGFKDEWIVNQMKSIRNLKSMTIFFLIINFLNLAVVISNYYWANFEYTNDP